MNGKFGLRSLLRWDSTVSFMMSSFDHRTILAWRGKYKDEIVLVISEFVSDKKIDEEDSDQLQ